MKVYQIHAVIHCFYGDEYRLKSSYSDKKQAKTVCAELNKKATRNTYKILTLNVIEPKQNPAPVRADTGLLTTSAT